MNCLNFGEVYTTTEECLPVDVLIIDEEYAPFAGAIITSFFPDTLNAGTGDTLTVIGTGFGTGGKFMFSNADNGGISFMTAAVDDLVWNDTMIKVRVPSSEAILNKPAGSGRFKIEIDTTETLDTSGLVINYAVANTRLILGTEARRRHITDEAADLQTDSIRTIAIAQSVVDSTSDAIEIIQAALCLYTENTGIAWELEPTIYIDSLIPDSVNIIRFVENDHPTIMNVASATAVTESDIDNCIDPFALYEVRTSGRFTINLRADLPSIPDATADNWYFGLTGNPGNREMDFYSIILHELGHAHGYKHVNDTTDIMYYSLNGGMQRREMNDNNAACGADILKTGIEELGSLNTNCKLPIKITDACIVTSTKNKAFIADKILLYPNPTESNFNLLIEDFKGGKTKINIYNSIGQLVESKNFGNLNEGKFQYTFSLANQTSGIYFVTLVQDKIYSLGAIQKI